MTRIHFIRATPQDARLLARLNRQLIEDEGHRNKMTLPELEARMRTWLVNEYKAILFTKGEGPIAYALYRQERKAVCLRQFFVDRDHRRQGIGRQAMALLLTEVWPPNTKVVVEVLARNLVGHKFWRAMGFEDYAITMENMPHPLAE